MKANDLSGFSFRFAGAGHYKVTYTTGHGDYYVRTITDMTIIDATKNAEWAKIEDIRHLRYLCRQGDHYHRNGKKFD